jgi:hypothetical protein
MLKDIGGKRHSLHLAKIASRLQFYSYHDGGFGAGNLIQQTERIGEFRLRRKSFDVSDPFQSMVGFGIGKARIAKAVLRMGAGFVKI